MELTIDTAGGDNKQPSLDHDASRPAIHVLVLTPFFPFAENEVRGCFIHEPLTRLARIGVTSTVFSVQPVYYPRVTPSPVAPAHWIRYPQLPGNFGLASSGWFLYTSLARKMARLHRQRPIDVIHAHGALPCGHAAALVSRRLKIPYVVTVHGLDVFSICGGHGAPAEWRQRRSVEVYKAARAVICISGKIQQIVKADLPEARSVVAYNGVDAELFSPRSDATDASSQSLLTVGDIIPSKGQELVLRALARLAVTFPRLRAHFIGEGPQESRLRSLSAELGLTLRVQFMGRRSRTEVAAAMQNCSVFVLPSRSEGLGCVYLEAMSCGKPVIACREQGIEELIEHGKNGWLIAPDNLDELVQALRTLLEAGDVSSKIGEAGRDIVLKQLTLQHQAQALAAVYRNVIQCA